MAQAVETVAKTFPDTNLAIIDSAQADMKSSPQNVERLLFHEEQSGYLAGLVEKQGVGRTKKGSDVISSAGGQKIPPVDHSIAGYQTGGADPGIQTPNAYSQSFTDRRSARNWP